MAGRTRPPGALATDAVLPPHLNLRLRRAFGIALGEDLKLLREVLDRI